MALKLHQRSLILQFAQSLSHSLVLLSSHLTSSLFGHVFRMSFRQAKLNTHPVIGISICFFFFFFSQRLFRPFAFSVLGVMVIENHKLKRGIFFLSVFRYFFFWLSSTVVFVLTMQLRLRIAFSFQAVSCVCLFPCFRVQLLRRIWGKNKSSCYHIFPFPLNL